MPTVEEFLAEHAKGQSWASIGRAFNISGENARRFGRRLHLDNHGYIRTRGKAIVRDPKNLKRQGTTYGYYDVLRNTLPQLPCLTVPMYEMQGH